ncbi:MAG: hypothetical protein ACXWR1_11165 [Bdellovibrionota bacterium]
MKFLLPMLLLPLHASALDSKGTRLPGQESCGPNYMLPGSEAYLGSHTFIILGADDDSHILAEHRSGTPPHNYQFLLRVRLDPPEMAFYKKLLAESKRPSAFTTVYFDDKTGQQLDRTFWCLYDMEKIFGGLQQKGDVFEKLFPIRASLLKNPDHEGDFNVQKPWYPGGHFTLQRADVELLVFRYLPAYLPQDELRKSIHSGKDKITRLFTHAPIAASEPEASASVRASYAATDGAIAEPGKDCPHDFQLKKAPVPKTIHSFLLMGEAAPDTVYAVSYYDQAPHNFQEALRFHLSAEEMKTYRRAKEGTRIPPLLQTRVGESNSYFCLADLRKEVQNGTFAAKGTLYRASGLNEYHLGEKTGVIELDAKKVEVLVNRPLVSFLNPQAVAKDVLGR